MFLYLSVLYSIELEPSASVYYFYLGSRLYLLSEPSLLWVLGLQFNGLTASVDSSIFVLNPVKNNSYRENLCYIIKLFIVKHISMAITYYYFYHFFLSVPSLFIYYWCSDFSMTKSCIYFYITVAQWCILICTSSFCQ